MYYIFIDESGDLGTKKSSSKYFVMAGVKVDDYKKLDRIITKTRRETKKNLITSNEIKGSNLPKEVKIEIFEKLDNVDYETFIIILEKINRYKFKDAFDNKKLYDNIASELAKLINIDSSSMIFIDKSKNKEEEIIDFNEKFVVNLNNFKRFPVEIDHVDSKNYKGLQLADLIAWSAFQSVENENMEFIDLLKNKVIKKV